MKKITDYEVGEIKQVSTHPIFTEHMVDVFWKFRKMYPDLVGSVNIGKMRTVLSGHSIVRNNEIFIK